MPTKPIAPPADDTPATKAALSGPQRALQRLGLIRPIDLALHLPLRYEDETQVTPIARASTGEKVQVEGVVLESRVELRGRRQFVVKMTDDSRAELVLRFLNFYPSHQKTFAAG
jgi:ATP-dependent DNA helicase RecG